MDRVVLLLTHMWTLTTISNKCTNDDSISNMNAENNQMFKNESGKNTTKHYSCKACGNTFEANPPDDVYSYSSVVPCWNFDWVERSYQCSRCNKNIKLFWHPEVHKHRDYATVEEIELKSNKDTIGNSPDYARRMVGY